MYILYLPLYKDPFEVMITGEKDREYRKPTKWIKSRLYKNGKPNKIDYIKFANGYAKNDPYFIASCDYFQAAKINYNMEYSNGLKVRINKGDFIIKLGVIIEYGNINGIKQLRLIDYLNIKL